ncbi:MAG: hypothetical protein HKL91_08575 [Candidatus Eremiobacteraeota bacterium]|uniref:Uncharacterized protein n=1 Tax=mine drainage metagenome TaxID=410659 RepID=E6PFS7_9ZZZZ|nr:hypothetical protein [Candidatus Eremiobacteraeota bacterium]
MLGCATAEGARGDAVAARAFGLVVVVGAAVAPGVEAAGFVVVAVFAQALKRTSASIAVAVLRIIDR